jgi:solute carrier family 25 S-adenosylmethionine transporter 26
VWLASGALAGLSVDMVLFPLDTIKTRMQSKQGLRAAGGFGKLFAGVASAAAGSAPTAALFFFTYESTKALLSRPQQRDAAAGPLSAAALSAPVNPLVHCTAASVAEVMACLVRVPTENVKQKVQAGHYRSSFECFRALMKPTTAATSAAASSSVAASAAASSSPAAAASASLESSSALRNFYRGFGTTILREIPFAFIQFPLYEAGKTWLASRAGQRVSDLPGWQCACVGSLAGAVAAALTCPLDVIKTRLMLQSNAAPADRLGFGDTFRALLHEGGPKRLFAGVVPRVMWISIGGFVFFGAYEGARQRIERLVRVTD